MLLKKLKPLKSQNFYIVINSPLILWAGYHCSPTFTTPDKKLFYFTCLHSFFEILNKFFFTNSVYIVFKQE